MASKHPPLTPYARHLMSEIAKGRNQLWRMAEKPNGWIHIERAGLATRAPAPSSPLNRFLDRAQLTAAGFQWIKTQADRNPEPCIDCGSTLHRTGTYHCPEVNKTDRED